VLWAVAGGCWLLLTGLAVLNPGLAHHHGVVADLRSGTAVTAALTTFAGAWLVMVAAMMLPSTVPMVRMFAVVTARVERRTRVRAVFLSAYFAVWLAFAVVALIGDAAVHAVVDTAPWLRERDDLVLAGALALAGVEPAATRADSCSSTTGVERPQPGRWAFDTGCTAWAAAGP